MAVVVAGGTKGIGLEIARGLAHGRAGDSSSHLVLGYAHDADSARSAEQELRTAGHLVTLVQADLGTPEGAQRLVDAVPEGEHIESLVHSAVTVATGPLAPSGASPGAGDWEQALAVNATSLLWLVRAARSRLVAGSHVLYLTSRGARVVVAGYGSVGPAKSLGEALMRYLAVELAPEGIRVNALAPGTQDTDALRDVFGDRTDDVIAATLAKNPTGRLVEPADYVAVARFLDSPAASMVTGQVYLVHGGADLLG